jgi:hypothetical protein
LRVSNFTRSVFPRTTFDTVITDTPAALDTSPKMTRRLGLLGPSVTIGELTTSKRQVELVEGGADIYRGAAAQARRSRASRL